MLLNGGMDMGESIHLEVKRQDIIQAVKRMSEKERLAFIEDLLGATSPEYLESIKEARADYLAGRVKDHSEVFGS
jgi:cystathionine beta-lyase family protein involved in aluminum resistance